MVYLGKPSRGCQMCRTRRIKCDETKPTCNQCAKSRRQCPGYRDDFDIVFRNETQATERRAKKASRKTVIRIHDREALSKTKSWSGASTPRERLSPDRRVTTISPALEMPHGQLASCHFFANFVMLPKISSGRGFMDYLVPLLKLDPKGGALTTAFDACAFAFFGNRVTSDGVDLAERALGRYTKALAATHVALKDSRLSQSDSTLATVLLLGLYENITARNIGTFAWGSHIEGAVQMLKTRGRDQIRTPLGLQLWIAVRTQMIVHSFKTGEAPINGVEWWIDDTIQDKIAAESQRLSLKTAELRAGITRIIATVSRSAEGIEHMLNMIRKLQAIDFECVAWTTDLPESWQWKTVAWEDRVPNGDYAKADVFPGRVDLYPDLHVANCWNQVRICRLWLSSMIIRCAAWICSPIDYRTTPEYAASSRISAEIVTDMIASIPFYLGWHLKRRDVVLKHNLTAGFACGEDDSIKGLAGYFLTWPLVNLHFQDCATDAQRAWIAGRLMYISRETGIRYAEILTNVPLRVPSMLIYQDCMMVRKSSLSSSSTSSASPSPSEQQQRSPKAAKHQTMAAGGSGAGPLAERQKPSLAPKLDHQSSAPPG